MKDQPLTNLQEELQGKHLGVQPLVVLLHHLIVPDDPDSVTKSKWAIYLCGILSFW